MGIEITLIYCFSNIIKGGLDFIHKDLFDLLRAWRGAFIKVRGIDDVNKVITLFQRQNK